VEKPSSGMKKGKREARFEPFGAMKTRRGSWRWMQKGEGEGSQD